VCNEELDALLKEQATTLDTAKRIELYYQIQQLMYDETLYIGIWRDPDLWSLNSHLQGVVFSGASPFWNAAEWFVSE
jgi:ABC-type transport system substrate-binding protein